MHKAGICCSFGTRRAAWHFLARLFPPSSDAICLPETLKLPSVNFAVNTQLSRLLGGEKWHSQTSASHREGRVERSVPLTVPPGSLVQGAMPFLFLLPSPSGTRDVGATNPSAHALGLSAHSRTNSELRQGLLGSSINSQHPGLGTQVMLLPFASLCAVSWQ